MVGRDNIQMLHQVQHDEGEKEQKNRHPGRDPGSHGWEGQQTDAASSSA